MSHLTDPTEALRPLFREALAAAFGDEFRDEDPVLRPSTHAHLQANLAMGLARKVKQAPRAVAEALAAKLPRGEVLAQVEIAGPGFLNLTLADAWIEGAVNALASDARLGVARPTTPERVVIDYSAPNVAKEMHVGHLRSSIIGDALARTLSWLGHEVIRQNHIGDWGTPFGMLIEHLLDVGGEQGGDGQSVGELSAFYKAARKKFDSDPAFAERARARVVALQAGEPETLRLWKVLVGISQRYFASVYDKLGVSLTEADIRGESFYNPRLVPLCDELAQEGKAVVSDGALCVFVPGFVTKEKTPLPLMIRKKDGGFGYATTDLAAIRYRLHELEATRLLYVVGTPQEQHLSMVFKAAQLFGWMQPPARAEHVNFGSVLGPDNKMLKSREGDAARLVDLLDSAIERAVQSVNERFPELDEQTKQDVGRQVGIGAVKFFDLSSDRVKDYVFDLDRMVKFEGKTGPYVQYAHARIQSIFRKAGEEGGKAAITLSTDPKEQAAERALSLKLLGFADALAGIERTLQPHLLCTYLYELADAFSTFFEACPVLKADPAVRASRLSLLAVSARVLSTGLTLLGIAAPQRM